jgi:hypothetical protein
MQREQRRDPRHLPTPEERKRTTEPLKPRRDKAKADADQIRRPGSSDIDRPNNQV